MWGSMSVGLSGLRGWSFIILMSQRAVIKATTRGVSETQCKLSLPPPLQWIRTNAHLVSWFKTLLERM